MHNLAGTYYDQDQYSESETLYKQCLAKRKVVLGECHPETLRTMRRLEKVRQKLGKN